jgi:3-hydroxy-9,10-secoandrosta-1,3,5(10)-triene-9,17-dione monooxygenase reductase component
MNANPVPVRSPATRHPVAPQARVDAGDRRLSMPGRQNQRAHDPKGSVMELVSMNVMKDIVGHFASGVVAVTGMEGGLPIGFTCQSFVSLSLDPPLISICPAATSTTWPRLRELGRFCVNVLSEEQQDLSATFARSGINRFASVHWRMSPAGAPLLEGVCAWLDCELWREYDGGDHTIVVGRVDGMGTGPARRPLLFHRGRYGIQQVSVSSSDGE